jgi:sulfur carrier protein ThiS
MIADFYTKPLQGALFRKMRDIIMGLSPFLAEERVETNENMAAGRNKLCAPKRTYADVLTQRTYKPSGILLNNNG